MLLALMIQIKFASAQLSACHNNKSQICRLSSPPVGAVCNNKHVTATQPSLLLLLLLLVRLLPALPGNRKSSKVVSLGKAELLAAVPHRGPALVLSASCSFWCSRNSRSPREAGWGAEATAGTGQGCGAPGASASLPPAAFLPPGHSLGFWRQLKKGLASV